MSEIFKEKRRIFREGVLILSIAMMFGIAAISKQFVPWFFGKGFEPCTSLVIAFTPVMIIKSISTTIRYQYLIPNNRDKVFIASVFTGALANIIANLLLIPNYGAMGAILGTLIAESVACIVQIVFIQRDVNIFGVFMRSIPYIIMGIVMFVSVRIVAEMMSFSSIMVMLIEVVVGVVVFVIGCAIYCFIAKDKTVIYELLRVVRR